MLVLTVGAIHLYLWVDYFYRVLIVGTLFILDPAAGGLLAVAPVRSGNAIVLAAAAGYSASTLAAFLVSTKWSLLGHTESLWGRWQEEAAATTELAAILLVARQLVRSTSTRARCVRLETVGDYPSYVS